MDVVIKIPCGTKAHTYIPILVSFAWRHPSRSLLPVFHIDFGDLKHAGRGVEPCQDRHASLWWCDGGGVLCILCRSSERLGKFRRGGIAV